MTFLIRIITFTQYFRSQLMAPEIGILSNYEVNFDLYLQISWEPP